MISTVILAAQVALAAAAPSHAYTVQPHDTLSGIAAAHGATLSAIEQANPAVTNPDVIYVGQSLNLVGSSGVGVDGTSDPAAQPAQPGSTTAPASVSIPGMPQALANCIWYRESTNGTNPAAHGNQFGIILASGYTVAGDSVAQQEQVAGQIYASAGGAAWLADGCPGT